MTRIAAVTLLVRNYDDAIAWFTQKLGFGLVEDVPLDGRKRWVLVAPPDGGVNLLLAVPVSRQSEALGYQAGGRVFLILNTDDFARDYNAFRERGVVFTELSRYESYGTVAVFEDISGNRWDLIEPKERS